MFDWARGSLLKKFIDLEMYRATWNSLDADWLKNWHTPWLMGLIDFHADMSILDVGSSSPVMMKVINKQYGCDVHAMDADVADANGTNFGFSNKVVAAFPHVKLHYGFAGDEILPAESFDLVTCISTLEHTYDRTSPLDAESPMSHFHALRDMVRMLKPGGLLLMNWDFYLHESHHNVGYDYESDYCFLRECGLELACHRRRVRGMNYIYDHPDSLFFDHESILGPGFDVEQMMRGTAVNILWRKPGRGANARFRPRTELEPYYFPEDETISQSKHASSGDLSTEEIDHRFRTLISRFTDVIGRTDIDGSMPK